MSYERIKDFYRTGWRPGLGWALQIVVLSGGLYEFVIRHFLRMPGNDLIQFVAFLTAAGALAGLRGWEKRKENG